MLAALVPALGPPLCGLVLHLAYTPGHCVCAALLLLALTGMAFGVAGLIDADKAEIIVETGLYAQRRHLFLCGPHADGLQLAHPPSSLLTDTGAAQWSSVFLFSAVRLAAFFCAYIPIFSPQALLSVLLCPLYLLSPWSFHLCVFYCQRSSHLGSSDLAWR